LRNRTPEELQRKWPKLVPGTYTHKSQATARYNCLAFALGDEKHWVQGGLHGGRYWWPENVPKEWSLGSLRQIFINRGYETVSSRDNEAGFEKVAIYVDLNDGSPSHVSISNGTTWMSKLGRFQDIEHISLDLLEGDGEFEYGIVEVIFRRPIR
jgi:hypothetical protein